MPRRFDRLTLKITLVTVVFALLMATAGAILVTSGFRHAQRVATTSSANGLEAQGRDALLSLTQREAELSSNEFARAERVGQIAASYLVRMAQLNGGVPWDAARRLRRTPGGPYGDPDPGRQSDVFIPRAIPIDSAVQRDLRASAALDALFPALLAQVPDATAIYYTSPHDVTRYYPPIGIAGLLQPNYSYLRATPYTQAMPAADPDRATVWQAPYIDPQLDGLLVTASTPVYDGTRFRGVVGVDVSLTGLVAQLTSIKPTRTGYAFLVDRHGKLIAAPFTNLADLVGPTNVPPAISITTMLGLSLTRAPTAAFRRALDGMRAGRHGVNRLDLGGRPAFLAYAPLSGPGWSLGLVAPIAEITRQSGAVAAAIHQDANATIAATLTALGVSFALIVLATLLLSRWLLVRPIATLTAAAHRIAAGDLSVAIPASRGDELGQLARAFNTMSAELAHSYEGLEQRVQERTRELSTLLDVSHTVTSTLDLEALLDVILDQLHVMVPYDSATILTLEHDHLSVLDYRGPASLEQMIGLRFSARTAPHRDVIEHRTPVIFADVGGKSALTFAFERTTGQDWNATYGNLRSWMGVPLLVQERVIGMLVAIRNEPGYYTAHHARLATTIAAQASVAMENARLYAQAQQLAAFEERARLARELHDSVSQALYGIALGARTALTLSEREPARTREPLEYVLSLAEAGLAEMRALIFELRPESLATEGLVAALGHQIAALEPRHGIAVRPALGTEPDVSYVKKEVLYRIAQEALHNVVKHARASTVTVALDSGPTAVVLEVGDDGIGFDAHGSFPGHLGLRSMRERAATVGGWVQLESAAGRGTCVRVSVPVAEEPAMSADADLAAQT